MNLSLPPKPEGTRVTRETHCQEQTKKPLRKGTRVKIYNTTYGGKVILEGVAKVVRPIAGVDDYYRVQFDDGMCFDRFIQLENIL